MSSSTLNDVESRTLTEGKEDLEAGLPDRHVSKEAISDQDITQVPRHPSLADQEQDGDSDESVIIVNWEGTDDPKNPRNWSFRKKWGAIAIVSAFTFISPIASSMVAPASAQIASEMGIRSSVVTAMTISVFILAYAIGPLFLGPLSEIYGRSRVLQIANMWFFAWNLGCGFAQNTAELIVFRFFAGLGGSAPLSIGGGVIGDLFHPQQRGQAIAIYTLAPLVGPTVAPVAGAWIAERSTWRWVFWATTIADACVQAMGLLFLKETYGPVLLERKAATIRASLSAEKRTHTRVRTVFESDDRNGRAILQRALTRPFAMFAREPILDLISIYTAFLYGLLYLFITTLPEIFQQTYHQPIGLAGLHYIALGLGLFTGAQIGARVLDRSYKYFTAKNGGVARPEYRLPQMMPATLILPAGLLLAGWTAQNHVFWFAPDVGIYLVGLSIILMNLSLQSYIIDTFTLFAASALAASTFLRSLAGFGFPLFAPAMFHSLGYGKGDTVLAAVAFALAPVPFFFWKFGERIRGMSKTAHKA
ncbi:MFS polyamine transporter [Dentipellis sp. KUC8613]|nr:MFS polyamine transporter [Dentipellis sp. KUC8613]